MKRYDVIIIGAGPCGIFTSINIRSKKTLLIDANDIIGGKIKVSGGGRCNVANNKGVETFLKSVYKNEKFLYPTLNNYSSQNIIEYFEKNKIQLKEESDNKMFPKNNSSSEFLNFFQNEINQKNNLETRLNYKVEKITLEQNIYKINEEYESKELVICTGGVSYPHISQGHTMHNILEHLGHSITDLKPASTPLVVTSDLIASRELQGITLKGTTGQIYINGKKKKTIEKDILITHFGLSGPLALDPSCFIKEMLDKQKVVDFKIILNENIPNKIKRYLDKDKSITFNISDVKGFKTAFLTNGGVSLKEVSPQTLESKINKNLYIGGEVLNIHAVTGGYNIAICLSEGKLIADVINSK